MFPRKEPEEPIIRDKMDVVSHAWVDLKDNVSGAFLFLYCLGGVKDRYIDIYREGERERGGIVDECIKIWNFSYAFNLLLLHSTYCQGEGNLIHVSKD